MENSQEEEHRNNRRANVFLSAHLTNASGSFVVRVRNLSERGAMLEGADLPVKGSVVTLDRAHLTVSGVVVWVKGNVRGVRFDREIDVRQWVRRVGHSGQHQVDRTVEALKAGRPLGHAGRDAQKRSTNEIGKELSEICDQIASVPDLSIDVGENLVRIEAIAIELMGLTSDVGHPSTLAKSYKAGEER